MDRPNIYSTDAVQSVRSDEVQPKTGLLPDLHGDLPEDATATYTNGCMEALDVFLADKCEATKAKYAAEMENADAEEWRKPLDLWYADSLVYFGLLERRVETLYSGPHVRGSRTWFRKAQKRSIRLCEYSYTQTEMAL